MTKKKILMRAADAMLLPNCPFTKQQYQKWVKESGIAVARSKKVEVEVDA